MSSNGNIRSKKRKRSSPFRIKLGCVVAIRFRTRENRIQIEGQDGRLIAFGEKNDLGFNVPHLGGQDPVELAHFSEVWTDPLPGHDDGLALIGSRIRCFYPKTVLFEPYNATSRRLEGEIVDVINYCEEQYTSRREAMKSERISIGLLVDLLVDNKDDKLLKAFPFLQRVDTIFEKEQLLAMSETERRSYENEMKIKGGRDKAIVRVLLNDEISSGIPLSRKTKEGGKQLEQLQAKWVIRKRVPAKIVRAIQKATTSNKGSKSIENKAQKDERCALASGDAEETFNRNKDLPNNENNKDLHHGLEQDGLQSTLKEDSEEPEKKKRIVMKTNKDFSSSRFLGDGNDTMEQQEANWRWKAAKYNPHSVLSERPLSKGLIEKLCYNFVGEVLRIQPETSPGADTLATVTIRCLVLPEHTLSGRSCHHSPCDIFDLQDLSFEGLESHGIDVTSSNIDTENSDIKSEQLSMKTVVLRVPIEDLVIVKRKVYRGVNVVDEKVRTTQEMSIRHSYSFCHDAYRALANPADSNLKISENGSRTGKRCLRCQQESSGVKSVAGAPHPLCQFCVKSLRAAALKTERTEPLNCDCDHCVIKNEIRLLSDLSDEVLSNVSSLGNTINELKGFSSQSDSGFVATRFVVKGMVSVDFAWNPTNLGSAFTSSSSKVISKIPQRIPKKNKRSPPFHAAWTSKADTVNRDGKKSPMRAKDTKNGNTAVDLISCKREVFRPTSARTLTYDVNNRRFDASATEVYQWKLAHLSKPSQDFPELPKNHRKEAKADAEEKLDHAGGGKKLIGRAARASQRRLVRSIAAMGFNVDTLATREQQLRFDRSGIHDWGVFVDIDIREGEMIVEYRGEVIGNAMAEKREKEYHEAKLGSDYMFRIDEFSLCAMLPNREM